MSNRSLFVAVAISSIVCPLSCARDVPQEIPEKIVWQRIFGGEKGDRANAIEPTVDGGFIVVGGTESKGAGDSDIWMLKLDAEGQLLWDRTFGGEGFDTARSVRQAANGDFIVTGSVDTDKHNYWDAWIVRPRLSDFDLRDLPLLW